MHVLRGLAPAPPGLVAVYARGDDGELDRMPVLYAGVFEDTPVV